MLEILARHRARATFFLIGEHAFAQPGLVEALRAAGHEIGNHSINRGSILRASDDDFVERLLRTERILQLDGQPKLFRPPARQDPPVADRAGGRARLSRRAGLGAIPYDPGHPPPGYIRWIVTKNLAPGVIVILHDGIPDPSRTIAALDSILAEGQREGLSVRHRRRAARPRARRARRPADPFADRARR